MTGCHRLSTSTSQFAFVPGEDGGRCARSLQIAGPCGRCPHQLHSTGIVGKHLHHLFEPARITVCVVTGRPRSADALPGHQLPDLHASPPPRWCVKHRTWPKMCGGARVVRRGRRGRPYRPAATRPDPTLTERSTPTDGRPYRLKWCLPPPRPRTLRCSTRPDRTTPRGCAGPGGSRYGATGAFPSRRGGACWSTGPATGSSTVTRSPRARCEDRR